MGIVEVNEMVPLNWGLKAVADVVELGFLVFWLWYLWSSQ